MKKRLLSLLLVLTLVAAFVGCTSTTEQASSANATETTEATAATEDTAAPEDDQIVVAPQGLALGGRRAELVGQHAHRNAGLAIEAGRAIGDGLATAETDPAERIVERIGVRAFQLCKHLSLAASRQVGARCRTGHKEAGEANWCRHGLSVLHLFSHACAVNRRQYAHLFEWLKAF